MPHADRERAGRSSPRDRANAWANDTAEPRGSCGTSPARGSSGPSAPRPASGTPLVPRHGVFAQRLRAVPQPRLSAGRLPSLAPSGPIVAWGRRRVERGRIHGAVGTAADVFACCSALVATAVWPGCSRRSDGGAAAAADSGARRSWRRRDADGRNGRATDEAATQTPSMSDTADAGIGRARWRRPRSGRRCRSAARGSAVALLEGMAYVPAGPFVMGMEVDPAHEVYASRRQVVDLPTFCIETLEVTNEEYRRCEEQGRCRAPRLGYGPDEHPVVGVNWSQAAAYCESVGRRLPTASEWEKTARGGCEIVEPPTCGPEDERRYPWGVDEPTCERANYRGCTRDGTDAADGRTAGASPYGVLQMLGNAAEWVDGLEGYDRIAGFDRGDDAAHDSVERASYGCSWFCDADDLEISSRWSNQPRSDDRFQGFRCATTVEPLRSVEIEWASDRRARAVQQPGSGLWWLRCNGTPALDPYCGEATWAEAGAICPPGWRLPERFELVALLGGVGGCSPRCSLPTGRGRAAPAKRTRPAAPSWVPRARRWRGLRRRRARAVRGRCRSRTVRSVRSRRAGLTPCRACARGRRRPPTTRGTASPRTCSTGAGSCPFAPGPT